MQYDQHSEYPLILRRFDNVIMGTWYENQFKPYTVMLDELEALGMTQGVEKIRQFETSLGKGPLKFQDKLELQRRVNGLASRCPGYNPFHLMERVGEAYFEPITDVNWAVTGNSEIEWGQESPEHDIVNDVPEKRYRVLLDGAMVYGLEEWNRAEERWVSIDMVIVPHGSYMNDKFGGMDLTASICKEVTGVIES